MPCKGQVTEQSTVKWAIDLRLTYELLITMLVNISIAEKLEKRSRRKSFSTVPIQLLLLVPRQKVKQRFFLTSISVNLCKLFLN